MNKVVYLTRAVAERGEKMKRRWLVYLVVMTFMMSGCMNSQASDKRPDVSKLEPQVLSAMMRDAGVENVDALDVQASKFALLFRY